MLVDGDEYTSICHGGALSSNGLYLHRQEEKLSSFTCKKYICAISAMLEKILKLHQNFGWIMFHVSDVMSCKI